MHIVILYCIDNYVYNDLYFSHYTACIEFIYYIGMLYNLSVYYRLFVFHNFCSVKMVLQVSNGKHSVKFVASGALTTALWGCINCANTPRRVTQ